ncbi:MAG: D-alanyl-D-alanine carboxypeptidase [Ruminococcaceae bacterium]|nr:D-alanyl-D-alanine carboxypeptidase [Oscillospiraceae bacterium]
MKRLLATVSVLILSCGVAHFSVKADNITVSASSAVLMDAATGEVLFAKDADTPRAMASTTKLMTALLAAEYGDWSETVDVTAEMVAVEGSSLGLRAGDTLTLWDVVCGMLLSSGNDAANAVALTLAPTLVDFAAMMNEKAAQLGMTNTTFVTPSGLDAERHLSTARDMATLGVAVLQDPVLANICKQKSAPISIGGRKVTVTNHNRLLSLYPDAIGMKTGFTKKAGRCLVSAASRDGLTLVAVTLNAPDDWDDHIRLFDYGFSTWRALSFPSVETERLPIVGGVTSETTLQYETPLPMTVLREDAGEITATVHLPPFVFAPVEAGAVVGRVEYRLNGKCVQTCRVRTVNAVAAVPLKSKGVHFWRYVRQLWNGLFVC